MTLNARAGALALLALLAAPVGLRAQADSVPPDTLPTYRLEGVTVTATRTPTRRALVPQQVEVVTGAELERAGARDLADALKRTVGADVIQYPGLLAGVSVRGFRPQLGGINQRTLVLVDGRPAGATNLATLGLADVQRVEVLKGPASALYGSAAMGGVVNVVTHRSTGDFGGDAVAGYGSYGSYRGELRAGGRVAGPLSLDVAASVHGRADDYRLGGRRTLGADSITKRLAGGGTLRVPELRGDTVLPFTQFGARGGSLRLGYQLGERWSLEGRGALFAADEVQNPGDAHAGYDSRTVNDLSRRSAELGVRGEAGAHSLLLRGYANRELTTYYSAPEPPSHVNLRTPVTSWGAQLQDAVRLGAHTLTAGLDWGTIAAASQAFSAEGTAAPRYSPDSRIASAAAFAQAQLSLLPERVVATLGGRLDRVRSEVEAATLFDGAVVAANDETFLVFNPSAGLLLRGAGGLRLHATAGRAFVAPDAFSVAGYSEASLSSGGVSVVRGNPALDPESSVTWDAGVGVLRPAAGLEADLTYFHTDVRDRITRRSVPLGGTETTPGGDTIRALSSFANADRAEIRGLEGQLALDVGALRGAGHSLRLRAGATRILRAEEITGGLVSDVKNVADLTVNWGVEYDDLRRFGARLGGRYVGERLDSDFADWQNPGDVRYPAFLVLDLGADLRVAGRHRIGLRVENLTDENYYEIRGYNLPGRTVSVQLGTSF